MYKVITPFKMNGEGLSRGSMINDDVELKKNFHFLRKDKYIEKMADREGTPFAQGCYIVNRSFVGRGQAFTANEFIDLGSEEWRNEASLLKSGYLRYATEDDVTRHSAHSPLDNQEGATPCPLQGSSKMWKNVEWLKDSYVDNHASIPEMAEEAGCSVSTIWTALKKADIKTRSRGRPTNE